jgi:hypothetical protein
VLEEVTVSDVPGVWLSGAPHFVYYFAPGGEEYLDSRRTVSVNTLIWRTDAFFYRLETDLARDEAIAIAETLP